MRASRRSTTAVPLWVYSQMCVGQVRPSFFCCSSHSHTISPVSALGIFAPRLFSFPLMAGGQIILRSFPLRMSSALSPAIFHATALNSEFSARSLPESLRARHGPPPGHHDVIATTSTIRHRAPVLTLEPARIRPDVVGWRAAMGAYSECRSAGSRRCSGPGPRHQFSASNQSTGCRTTSRCREMTGWTACLHGSIGRVPSARHF